MKKYLIIILSSLLILAILNVVNAVTTISSIEITKAPTKTEYNVGENFDKTGMIVMSTYVDGTKAELKNYRILNGENLEKNQNTVLINYTDGDRELEAIQEIIVHTVNEQNENIKTEDNSNNRMLIIAVIVIISLAVIFLVALLVILRSKK